MLRFRYRMRPRKFSATMGLGSGQEGRIKRMRMLVTELVRHERIESTYEKCDEARGYAERLIQLAAKHGDRHQETMEMADYWLMEKDLIHKLFKVLVPRFQHASTAMTDLYRLPTQYPGSGKQNAVLELKGNPWPPVLPREWQRQHFLHNVLLAELRREKSQARKQVTASSAAAASSLSSQEVATDAGTGFAAASPTVEDEGSSVDPPLSPQPSQTEQPSHTKPSH